MSDPGDPSFEQALARLEELVRQLESGELALEDSLARFEEGVALVKLCQRRLADAELRLSQLEETPKGPRERRLDPEEGA
jgi:exodeoxyribonuclease VII small subunit